MNKTRILSALFFSAFLTGCGTSDEEYVNDRPNPVCPPSTADHRYIAFSGYCWEVRKTVKAEAAGPNYYSNDARDVWVDDKGLLHMKISWRDGKWVCTELFASGQFGYGTYSFRMAGQIDQLDRNAVLGLFTWDNNCYVTGALSEIDVEFGKWGDVIGKNLQYSVQPTHGPDVAEGWYPERSASSFMSLTEPLSTHVFTWSPSFISFASYQGSDIDSGSLIANWQFLSGNPARRYDLATLSTPVVIPAPSPTTTIRLSLWLYDKNKDGAGDPPSNGQEIEVVCDSFDFTPM